MLPVQRLLSRSILCQILLTILLAVLLAACTAPEQDTAPRERIAINEGWAFFKYENMEEADDLIYDERPEVTDAQDDRPADAQPTEAVEVQTKREVLKPWILPSGNDFIADPAKRHKRPPGNPGSDFPFVQDDFDDSGWQEVTLPHDWAITGPFLEGWDAEVGGGMGRLPSHGVAWYRRKLEISEADAGKSIFLDIDGAMSYAMVWLNGQLVGGWPYGYNSFRLDLTPYVVPGRVNQLAIRLDNPPNSSRWYPGGGIYRNVWLVKTHPVHVSQWGTFVTTREVSAESAIVDLTVTVQNDSKISGKVDVQTAIYELNPDGTPSTEAVVHFERQSSGIEPGTRVDLAASVTLSKPKRWGPPPTQAPHRYVAVTTVIQEGKAVDRYETRFGIRDLRFDPKEGLLVNGEQIYLKGANQHHDLGALGAAFNVRAAERQLKLLREMGCNAIRMAHNPPAPELLELTDQMGFLVVDEVFDSWERKKTPLDFHLIFPDWHEQDLRTMIRRDRNAPSVIMWSFGNEVGEQYTGEAGAEVAKKLHAIVQSEDPTRPGTLAMNYAKPDMPLPTVPDLISLNYQGEGIRNAPAYADLKGINTPPLYPKFQEAFPEKVIVSSENAAALSSRGEYFFPVTERNSAPIRENSGGDPKRNQVSSYELYTADFGSSADKVFGSLAQHPFVAGGFVWSGWDYLGEPTPYYLARSSYFGVIDLAGFKKDRFYLYQAHWRPDFPMVHILPHWNWPERVGEVTPVHVFTSGDEVELFLNGASLGRKKKGEFEYRLRWDDVIYTPGTLRAVAYKAGQPWAEATVETAGVPAVLVAQADRTQLAADGQDVSFVSVRVADGTGLTVPTANPVITFELTGPGEIVATDNGDPTCMIPFPVAQRPAFNGWVLAIVRTRNGQTGQITVTAQSDGLEVAQLVMEVR